MTSSLFRVSLQSPRSPTPFSPSITRKACGSRGTDPHVARDGGALAFIADGQRCYAYDVYVGQETVGDVRPLGVTIMHSYNVNPVFVPGTQQIMYLAGAEEADGGRSRFSLYTVGRDGSDIHQIAGPKLFDDPLHWRGK